MSKTPIIVAAVIVAEVLLLGTIALGAAGIPSGIAVRASDVSVSVRDQSVWDSVVVESVNIPVDGWVVVRAAGSNGQPAAVLGYRAVTAGTSASLAVPVDRTDGLPGAVYVSLAADKGEPGVFEFDAGSSGGMGGGMGGGGSSAVDDRPLVANGALVQSRIRIKHYGIGSLASEATLGTARLSAAGDAVIVSGVSAPGPSWLAVTEAGVSESGAGEMLGILAVEPGAGEYTVKLDVPAGSRQLRVSLHADLGIRGTYEYDPGDVLNSPDPMYYTEASYLAVTVSK